MKLVLFFLFSVFVVYCYKGVKGGSNRDFRGGPGGQAKKFSRLAITCYDPLHYNLIFTMNLIQLLFCSKL